MLWESFYLALSSNTPRIIFFLHKCLHWNRDIYQYFWLTNSVRKESQRKTDGSTTVFNTCDYFQHKTQGDVHTYNRVMQNWNVRNLYRASGKDIVQWNLLYMKPFKDNMQEKSEYESLYDSAGNEGYMVCILVVVNLPLQTIGII